MFKRTLLVLGASLALGGAAFAQAPVNNTTSAPQPPATEQGQPRAGQYNPAGGATGSTATGNTTGTAGSASGTTGSSVSGSASGSSMNSSTSGGMGTTGTTDGSGQMRAARADRG